MPLAAVLTLNAVEATAAPAEMGRAVHAWFLDRVAGVDADLAQQLHDTPGRRPFTISNVWGKGRARQGQVELDPERDCWARVTALTDEVEAALEQALPASGEHLELAGATFAVRAVATETEDHPWAGRMSYTDLVERYTLSPGRHPRSVTLNFSSPTLFRSGGRDLPLPLPDLVFHGYLRKWNTFAPMALPDEARRYAEECVALSRYKLRSHLVSFERSGKGAHVGFTGRVRFRFLTGDAYWSRVIFLLAGYAFWAGTGYRTTVGLGQTQAVRRRSRS
jgi:CRISPR-associated endoribonuclease Cas6